MKESTDIYVTKALKNVNYSVMLACSELVVSWVEECIYLLEQGISVEIITSKEGIEMLKKLNDFSFNKILILLRKGGQIYTSDDPWNNIVGIKDYCELFMLPHLHKKELNNSLSEVRKNIDWFEGKRSASKQFMHEENDISIKLESSSHVILKGDDYTINWEVTNADKIFIEGLGEVNPSGRHTYKPASSKVFKIGAYNDNQTQLKTTYVSVQDTIDIHYDLSFANPKTDEYHSLVKSDNYPHVFGVANGNHVKLSWEVSEAEKVKVAPFGLSGIKGEHIFTPGENMTIEIAATVLSKTVSRSIKLYTFPIPIFKDKLVPLFQDKIPSINLNIPTLSRQSIDTIKDRQDNYSKKLRSIALKEKNKYNSLCRQIEYLVFENSTNKHILYNTNKSVLSVLRRFYKEKKDIVEVIDSLNNYYDHQTEN